MGEVKIVVAVSVLEPNQEPSKIHRDESVLVREAIFRNFWSVDFYVVCLLDVILKHSRMKLQHDMIIKSMPDCEKI